MKNDLKLFYLFFVLLLTSSCAEKNPGNQKIIEPDFSSNQTSDTLKFTSGIRAIFQDSKGNYWLGSLQEGVAVYNGNSFTYFTEKDGLSDNQIHSIQEDQTGTIWFNTQLGVSSYDGSRIMNHTGIKNKTSLSVLPSQQNEPAQGEWTKSDNDLWFEAGINEGVYRWDGNSLNYLAFPPHKVLNHHNNVFAVTGISKGANNRIWFGTYAGVFGYNGEEFVTINDETLGFDRKVAPLHIRSILEDSKDRLWIGNNGIGVLLKEDNGIINFSEEMDLIHLQSGRKGDKSPPGTLEHVFTIQEDSKGNIWFGDRDAGIWKYDGESMANYTIENADLSRAFALSIFEDKDEELWFGMADGSVYKLKENTFEKQF